MTVVSLAARATRRPLGAVTGPTASGVNSVIDILTLVNRPRTRHNPRAVVDAEPHMWRLYFEYSPSPWSYNRWEGAEYASVYTEAPL